VKHRFASHVVQTMLEVAPDTINREVRPSALLPCSVTENKTVPWYIPPCARVVRRFRRASAALPARVRPLRGASPPNYASAYLTALPSQELLPSTASLLADPFASHVLRALLILLRPALAPAAGHGAAKANLRSRKSAAWKARQGPLRSVFADDAGKPAAGARTLPKVPKTFGALARRVVEAVRGALGANEVRALAADKVASPLLQVPSLRLFAVAGCTNGLTRT
jgi:nucleolar protein 9